MASEREKRPSGTIAVRIAAACALNFFRLSVIQYLIRSWAAVRPLSQLRNATGKESALRLITVIAGSRLEGLNEWRPSKSGKSRVCLCKGYIAIFFSPECIDAIFDIKLRLSIQPVIS